MKVYTLEWEFEHLCDMNYDIGLLPFEGSKSLRHLMRGTDEIDLPKKTIEFLANFSVIESQTDYPIVDQPMPVMSKKMIDTLSGVGHFQHRLYPSILIDDTYIVNNRFDEAGELKKNIPVIDSFFIVQILEILKVLDYEHSIYEPMNEWEQFPTLISKLVLKEPEGGFPPLFRVFEKPSAVFVSREAKEALEANNTKGCVFKEVEVSN